MGFFMKFTVKTEFKWAHHGTDVVSYKAGSDLETDDQELIKVGLDEDWLEKPTLLPSPAQKKLNSFLNFLNKAFKRTQ